jgi:hypothetical protein
LAKKEKNISECSKIFVELLNLPSNDLIEEEVERVVEQISQSTNVIGESSIGRKEANQTIETEAFHRQLFQSLPQPLQYKLLLGVASRCKNAVKYCQLMILIMKRFPDKINEHALNLVDIVMHGESAFATRKDGKKVTAVKDKVDVTKDKANDNDDKNKKPSDDYFSKMLIFDVFPLILSSDSNLILNQDHVQEMLENLFQFFLQQSSLGKVTDKERLLIRDHDSFDKVQRKVRDIFQLIRGKMGWESLVDMQQMEPLHVQHAKLSEYYQQNSFAKPDSGPIDLSCSNRVINVKVLKQVFFTAFLLFLIYLDQYIRQTVSRLIVVQHHQPIQATKEKPLPNAKKRKITEQNRTPKPICNNESLQSAFSGANKFFEFLNQDHHLQQELFRLIQIIGLNQYKSYETFIIDTHIYRGDTDNLLTYFQKNKSNSLKSCIQLVSTSIAKGNHSLIIDHCVELGRLIEQMKDDEKDTEKEQEKSDSNGQTMHNTRTIAAKHLIVGENGANQLSFVPFSKYEILAYAVDVLILCLRESLDHTAKASDTTIGHLIVLSQFAWPRYLDQFVYALDLIKVTFASAKFVYSPFIEYVFNSDMLEEFMSLAVNDELSVELRIVSSPNGSLKPKSMTTRGVNKNAKEEIRNALTSQIRTGQSQPPIDLFVRFIVNELSAFTIAKQPKTEAAPLRKSARK